MEKLKQHLALFVFLVLVIACKQKQKEEPVEQKVKAPDTLINQQPEIAANTYANVDVSPMDMSYFPVDYPKIKMANANVPPPVIRLIYSRPQLQRRALFNGILKYDEPWRLGANEASEITFYKNVTIQGKKIKAGRYIIYGIPHHDKWTIILNSNIDTWGLKQDTTKDMGRFEIPISTNGTSLEYFTMVFEKTDTGANLVIAWSDIVAKLPIDF
ncbi:MAG TPA: DUF2911 domain-containing protein [Chitinophagaceae bacterium]|nr:DUF2911 domain-containing protein [Chitinophagaceae bacterium]